MYAVILFSIYKERNF